MMYKKPTVAILSFALILGFFSIVPGQAQAIKFNPFNPLDPFCLFTCDDDDNHETVYNTTGSYNTNSIVTTGDSSPVVQTSGATAVTSSSYGGGVYTTPTYSYSSYTPNQPSPLYVSCYPTPTSANVGYPIRWGSSVSGGTGSYHITWSGTEGLSGNGSTITKAYSYGGSKNASITVVSGGQTVSQNCSGTVTIYEHYNYSTPHYNYNYYNQYPHYNYSYSPLSVSCRPNTTFAPVGSYVTWTAYPSGGANHGYTYTWSGTDNLYGSQSAISTYYSVPGIKTAHVTVHSGGQQASAQCSSAVTVGAPVAHYNPTPHVAYNSGIQIACFADKTSTRVGVPVTWAAEATEAGRQANFTYAWTGTDGLSGNQSSIITTYVRSGLKSAVVTVTSPSGQSQSKACGNTVDVKNAATVARAATPTPTPTPQVVVLPPPPPVAAASILSLQNVPWGWVAVLVILVLLGMVFYLLFNKKKI